MLFPSKGFDITAQQWHALNRLWQEDGLQQSDLAKKIYKDYSFTTRLVDDLEKKNLVYREKDPLDRRANRVYLTEDSKKCKYPIIQFYLEMSEKLCSNISKEELSEFNKICKKLIVNYKVDVKE